MNSPVVLVIRKNDRFSALLRDSGFQVLNLELIKTETADDLSDLDAKLVRIDEYDGLFFTSPAAAEIFVERSKALGRKFDGKAYVLGERARKVLENNGFDVVYQDSANGAEELIESFDDAEFTGKTFLFVRGATSLRTIPRLLASKARIDDVVVYRTLELRPDKDVLNLTRARLENNQIDWICFFSPSGIDSFQKLFGSDFGWNLNIAVIGETTAKRAKESQLKPRFISRRASADDFALEFIQHNQ